MRKLDQRIGYLLKGYLNNSCTEEEFEELLSLIRVEEELPAISDLLLEELKAGIGGISEERVNWDNMLKEILAKKEERNHGNRRIAFMKWAAAAAVLVLVGLGGYFIFNAGKKERAGNKNDAQQMVKNDVPPGKDGAVLTLADGTSIVLDSMGNGALAYQNGIQVVKLNGRLSYNNEGKGMSERELFNTIVTPRGRQFQLILEDGTKVWLNAVSSIRFPMAFKGAERNVEVTGEVYFEVARNKEKPFRVTVNGVKMEVLGTAFNVNAYTDESAIRTTLAEGSVRVSVGAQSNVLNPGQQAAVFLAGASPTLKVYEVNVEEIVAWKQGFFQFNKSDIRTIMRQVARWYDVEVVYEPNIPDRLFTGDMPRDSNVSELLEILKLSNINFSIEGRRIVVKP